MNGPNWKSFSKVVDPYYWQTAILIARNGLARQYRNSFLGVLWTLLQPLMMVGVYTIVMPMIMRFPAINYTLYIVVSLPLWTFFLSSINMACYSILQNAETLKRCMISSTVFALADVLRNTYTFFVSFTTMYIVALVFFAPLDWHVLLVPLYFIPVFIIIASVAIAIAFLSPYARDMSELTILSMNVMFWLTPVVYPYSQLPERALAWMHWNPFFIMLHPIQLLGYEHVMPGTGDIVRLLALVAVAVLVGFSIFKMCRRNYVYYL